MPFFTLAGRPAIPVGDGVTVTTVWGAGIMLSFVEFVRADALVATHQHPHEQMGVCTEGSLELIIGGERRVVRSGEIFLVPPNTPHSARAVDGPARALDVFHPPREDYMRE
jgi:mannose-6-phosphate isomerase-like protein (cupin superfamily)